MTKSTLSAASGPPLSVARPSSGRPEAAEIWNEPMLSRLAVPPRIPSGVVPEITVKPVTVSS